MTQTANPLEIQLALSRVAVGIQSKLYKGAKLPAFEPQRKTVVHDCWHGGKLSEKHQRVWHQTVGLFRDAVGVSPGNGGYGDNVGGGDGAKMPTVYYNLAQERVEYLREFHLHHHEWRLLYSLILEHFQNVKLFSLQELGLAMDGYKQEQQARAAGVASLHRLLDSLAEFHGI